ncbi:energy-coupling factor ABC transporter ATP-binding protein [Oribacterium sp. oral taxon 102]|uniref:ABC transporter ATP-binding protein n=1 Tax=Oribacterium sp. oral taxon 102 TaxID=671214 RepID=UPI0015BC42EC|nr:ABC transporter ATP-binding protein [Oribacterium sp. oral taxon 102]NWO20961.1 energy-coupling factor ABC transporter ATP-binding protein [Oribacterium sp. oral taxon 102]
MAFVSVRNLKYRYPMEQKLALCDISFEIERGEFVGIIGANGAGKSSLSQALLGLIPQFYKGAYGGSVEIDGLDSAKTPLGMLCKKAGLVFQNPFSQLSGAKDTVFDEVAYGLQNLGIPREEILRRVEEVLHTLDIWDFRERNPFDLSGGQLQRVAIASILAMRPELLILDEPTSQLDPVGSEEVFQTVEKLRHSGITILMIEQKLEKLAEYCGRLLLLSEGRLIAFDRTERILTRPDLGNYGVLPPFPVRFAMSHGLCTTEGACPLTLPALYRQIPPERQDTLRAALEYTLRSAPSGSSADAPLTGAGDTAAPAAEPLFRIQDLGFSYTEGVPVLRNLSLRLDRRPTAIIGQNGAGKTTLARLIKGLLRPERGQLLFHGEDISRKTVAELAGKIGYVFQNPDDQIFRSSVLEEVLFGPLNIGISREDAVQKAREALRLVGLAEAEEKNPYDLDLSERKRIAIASVLAMEPELLILDEPTIAQDERGKEILRRILAEESAKGRLILAILHDMDFVLHSFERVIVMAKGEIRRDGSPFEVFRDEAALTSAALLPPAEVALYTMLDHK